MNTLQRFRSAYLGEPLDRPPVCAVIGLPLLERLTELSGASAILESVVSDPHIVIGAQRDLGLDPIITTVDDRWFSMHTYWRLLHDVHGDEFEAWQVSDEVISKGDFTTHRFVATTPEGLITWSYDVGNYQVGELERPIKEPRDLELIARYLPPPDALCLDRLADLVRDVGDEAFIMHTCMGVWGEAANMRGLVELCTDLFDRPEFVHDLAEVVTERAIRRMRHLAGTGVHSVIYDESWIGVGISPVQYREFIKPYDERVIASAREHGLLVSYHNCGRGMAILDDMVDCGGHALETLTPRESSGDFDLAEVKRRVGDRVTLNGGLNERILATCTPAEAKDAARRCLDAAAPGGRYILRTTGQIFDALPGTIEAVAEAAHEFQYGGAG